MTERRNTRKTLEDRLRVFTQAYQVTAKIEPSQPDQYMRYQLSLKKGDGDFKAITDFIKTTEMLNLINSAIRLREFI